MSTRALEDVVIPALDELPDLDSCLGFFSKIGSSVFAAKIHNLWDRHGPSVVEQFRKAGARHVWADLKLHDIPNTVKRRAQEVKASGADILTVHASGGIEMMQAALIPGLTILAVTVLTSLSEEDAHLTYGNPAKAGALYLARLAKLAGMDGIVCSPQEAGILAKRPELKGLRLVVAGIRSAGKDVGDQKRVDTPGAAIKAGATHLVVGRQITQAANPVAALEEIQSEIRTALAELTEKEVQL